MFQALFFPIPVAPGFLHIAAHRVFGYGIGERQIVWLAGRMRTTGICVGPNVLSPSSNQFITG
jgi:hypothetical protein